MELPRSLRKRRGAIYTLAFLRVSVGVVFLAHGWQKLGDIPGAITALAELGAPLPEWSAYIAIFCELLGGLGLALGLRTQLAALGPLLTTVAGMYLEQREHGFFVEHGGSEYSLMLAVVCLHFAVRGAGIYSVDALTAPADARFRRRHRQVAAHT